MTPHRQWIKFQYDGQSRITCAHDSGGEWARYAYNRDGMLIAEVDSTGRRRTYFYEGALMIAIVDENSRLLLRNWYDHGVVIRQRFANGDTYSYSYTWNAERTLAKAIRVSMPDGSEREIAMNEAAPAEQQAK